jgi:LAS superfamily LD-carboxypeptidase LdcB
MKHESAGSVDTATVNAGLIAGLIVAGFSFAYIRVTGLEARVMELSRELASTTAALSEATALLESEILALRSETVGISETLSNTSAAVAAAQSGLSEVKDQVGGVQQTVGSISGTVTTLEKLTNTDPELLQKYSKVFFLSENFKPARVAQIPQEYVYSNSKEEHFNADAIFFLQSMLARAKLDGVELFVKSAYRSFDEQQLVKAQHVTAYGSGTANAFSADQGYSEHQLGTTVDLVTSGINGQLTDAFDKTPAYQWLLQNAYRYGFILSYPKGNAFYEYEPWHWRFVGVKLAQELRNRNLGFYALDQREVDAYLATIFDPQNN